jgi:hypothetical protein
MSGFKEIIQTCVLSPQIPKYNHFRDIDVYQWHNGRREEERFKIKKKKVFVTFAHLSFHLLLRLYGAAASHG